MIESTIRPPHWTLLKGFIETPTLICYLFRFVLPENVYCHSVPAASMALTASSKAADGVSLSMPVTNCIIPFRPSRNQHRYAPNVPVNFCALRHPRLGTILVAAAGPGSCFGPHMADNMLDGRKTNSEVRILSGGYRQILQRLDRRAARLLCMFFPGRYHCRT
jgi:hypothetical protein